MRSPGTRFIRWIVVATATVGLLVLRPGRPFAHEVPASATVVAFVKPEGRTLRVVLRVPLVSMRDVDFPLRGPGFVNIEATAPLLPDLARLWLADYVRFFENGKQLGDPAVVAARVSLPSNPAFAAYESALAHVTGAPLPPATEVVLEQAMLDVLLEYPVASAESRFAVDPEWAHLGLRTATVLRLVLPAGSERAFRYDGNPGLVQLDPRWFQAARTFVALGFHHILDGIDHLLFVLCLVIPYRRIRPLLVIVTSFTVAHSVTLIASASGLAPVGLWFPPFIETLIALSIVYMAFENIVGPRFERRWVLAFVFGLVHGFGFSFVLRDSLQFAGAHLATSLFAFNVGVELGQVFVLVLAIPMLDYLFRKVVAERIGTILLSALVAHSAWHWMAGRFGELRQFRIPVPVFDLVLAADVMRWLMLALVLVGAMWLLYALSRRIAPHASARDSTAGLGAGREG